MIDPGTIRKLIAWDHELARWIAVEQARRGTPAPLW
jgi:hypothetical protein